VSEFELILVAKMSKYLYPFGLEQISALFVITLVEATELNRTFFRVSPLAFLSTIGKFGYTQSNQFVATHDDQLNMYRFIACLYQVCWLGGSCFAQVPPRFVCAF